ncbi:hypothetical protein YDYSY3_39160 [Paenibacillus chitinolyticus]|uniref:hypothetical protein n=1 Tax=Paenibacillus chitinolyticus TaxID=79263 RepID=UPI0026E4E5BA|nr:hypothetical protein [Paenibacillus chitinolyticus]GKS12916.1 hypothetical protein YDYSY3_39160 [Paenibacillus chitinolyticus]
MSERTNNVEEETRLVKEFTLYPILLDMLARDTEDLKIFSDKIVYHHILLYLQDIENLIHAEIHTIRLTMKKRDIKILNTNRTVAGVEVDYLVRGYVRHFNMLRSMIKADLLTLLMSLRRKV